MRTTWIICVFLIFLFPRESEPNKDKVDDQCLFLEKDRDLCPEMQPVWVVHKSQCKLAIRCRKGFTKDECQKNCMHGVNTNEATTTETAETAETTEAAETAESNPPSEVEETPEPPNKDDEN